MSLSRRARDELCHRSLDISSGEVLDVQLTLLPDGLARLHVNIDMVVADAQSFQVLMTELAALYAEPDQLLAPLDYSFAAYVRDVGTARSAAKERARTYWAGRLKELPPPPALPLSVTPERAGRPRATRLFTTLSAGERRRLDAEARAHEALRSPQR